MKEMKRYVSCPVSQKVATLHQFTFTMSNYNYRPLSKRDTRLNNHYTLYVNSLKKKTIDQALTSFYQKILCSYKIGYLWGIDMNV